MAEKWFQKEISDGLRTLYYADVGPGLQEVYILTAEEWAKFQALYRVAESIHSSRDHESVGYISDLEEAVDAIDGGTYNPEIAGDTNADV